LTQAREALGLSLEEAGARIRVKPEFLAALETMNVKLLPGRAYAKPYLRSYAALLDLPVDEIVHQFETECALMREDAESQIRNPRSKPRPERPWLAALALAGVCAAFVGYRALHDTKSEPEQKPTVVTHATPAPRPVAPEKEPSDAWGPTSQVVEVVALAPSWLEVRGPDGTIFLSRDMAVGESYKPDIGAGWTLHARDGAAFEIRLNGAVVGALGASGAPVLGRRVDAIAAAAGEG
jgi:transcriptional regulator with XRE-family HTH domain